MASNKSERLMHLVGWFIWIVVHFCLFTPWTWCFHCKTNRTGNNLSATSISSPFLFVLVFLSLCSLCELLHFYSNSVYDLQTRTITRNIPCPMCGSWRLSPASFSCINISYWGSKKNYSMSVCIRFTPVIIYF